MRKVSVYVPSTTNVDNPDHALSLRVTSKVAKRLSQYFGGATCTDGQGYYVADDGALIVESVHIVSSIVSDDALLVHVDHIDRLARMVKRAMSQESVLVEYTAAQARFI